MRAPGHERATGQGSPASWLSSAGPPGPNPFPITAAFCAGTVVSLLLPPKPTFQELKSFIFRHGSLSFGANSDLAAISCMAQLFNNY